MRNVFTVVYHRDMSGPPMSEQEKDWKSFLDLDQIVEWHPCPGDGCRAYGLCPGWHASSQGHGMIFPYATNLQDAIEAWKLGPLQTQTHWSNEPNVMHPGSRLGCPTCSPIWGRLQDD